MYLPALPRQQAKISDKLQRRASGKHLLVLPSSLICANNFRSSDLPGTLLVTGLVASVDIVDYLCQVQYEER